MDVMITDPVYLASGQIDCVVDFGKGPMPYTASADDVSDFGRMVFDAAEKMGPAAYAEPAPDPVADLSAERASMRASRYQVKAAMLEMGILPDAAAVATAGELVQIQWADMASFARDAAPITEIAAVLKLTDLQLDGVFRLALTY